MSFEKPAYNFRMPTKSKATQMSGKTYNAVQNILESTAFAGCDGWKIAQSNSNNCSASAYIATLENPVAANE